MLRPVAFCCIFGRYCQVLGVSLTGSLREVGGRFAHVELAGDHVGDEARAVLAEELDLAAGAGDGGVDVGGGLVEVLDDGGLFGEWWEGDLLGAYSLNIEIPLCIYRCLAQEFLLHCSKEIVQVVAVQILAGSETNHAVRKTGIKIENCYVTNVGSNCHYESPFWKHSANSETLLVQGLSHIL